jgi:benzoyl-CoA reductase/2-hydroxyglutaryl-CoA dehydratase subunit BcrC/BadD/HgdB
MQRDRVLFDIVEECGGQIVLDATETGQRGWCGPFDRRRLVEDPLLELAQAYFHLPDPSRRPNSGLYEWLRDNLARSDARGLVLHHYVWCDKWHAEFERIKEWIKLPMLRLDSEGQGEMDSLRVRNRVHAFVETLR